MVSVIYITYSRVRLETGASLKRVELLSFYFVGMRVGNGGCFERSRMDIVGYLIGLDILWLRNGMVGDWVGMGVARGFDLVGMDIVENLITLGWIVVEMK